MRFFVQNIAVNEQVLFPLALYTFLVCIYLPVMISNKSKTGADKGINAPDKSTIIDHDNSSGYANGTSRASFGGNNTSSSRKHTKSNVRRTAEHLYEVLERD